MGGDDEIADQGELQASAGADTVDTGDGDRDQVVDDVDRLLVHPDVPRSVVGSEVQESLDIVTGAKRFARSSQDQHPTVAIHRHVLDRGVQLRRDLLVERVVDPGAVQRDGGYRAVLAHDQLAGRRRFLGHVASCRYVVSAAARVDL
jgi:hypothetical protein